MTTPPARRGVLDTVRRVLAADCSCDPEDFDHDGTKVFESTGTDGGRRYRHRADPFIVTMGRGVVIASTEEHVDWLRQNFGTLDREAVFAARSIALLSDYLEQYQRIVYGPDLKYTCCPDDLPAEQDGHQIDLIEGPAVHDLYQYRGFYNALQYQVEHPQPDVLAAVVFVGGKPAGIAGASADTDDLWQIGVDVLPEYRAAGLGGALVRRLTRAIFDRGKTPYYSTSPSNLGSRRLARTAGFWPAWTELRTWDIAPQRS